MRRLIFGLLCVAAVQVHADEALIADTKKTALAIPPKLLQMLQGEIDKGNYHGAIDACNDKAPKMAAAASESTGWAIRRVSLRNRNPKAIPDAWEKAVLEDFDRRAASGENLAGIEKAEIVSEGTQKTLRYMKALPVQSVCIHCHGTADKLAAEVKSKLMAVYPDDKAIGYNEGQIRGALTVKRPLTVGQ